MSKTNTLTSHHSESRTIPAGMMNGRIEISGCSKNAANRYRATIKKFNVRKQRMFLKNPYNWEKF